MKGLYTAPFCLVSSGHLGHKRAANRIFSPQKIFREIQLALHFVSVEQFCFVCKYFLITSNGYVYIYFF